MSNSGSSKGTGEVRATLVQRMHQRLPIVAIHHRHVAIGNNHVKPARAPRSQALGTVFGIHDAVPQVAQLLSQQHTVGRVVVHHQNAQRARRDQPVNVDIDMPGIRFKARHVEADINLCTFARLTAHLNRPAHHFAERAANHQPQP